jgi:hypothetical protein
MRRYTLNERGRTIFIYVPIMALAIIGSTTNAVELLVSWLIK